MAEVPSSYEDAGMVDSTAVDYQMARDDRNPSIDSEFVNGTAAEEEEESGKEDEESDVELDEPEQMESALQHFMSVLSEAQETALAFKMENRKRARGHYTGNSKRTQERNRQKSRLLHAEGYRPLTNWFSRVDKSQKTDVDIPCVNG